MHPTPLESIQMWALCRELKLFMSSLNMACFLKPHDWHETRSQSERQPLLLERYQEAPSPNRICSFLKSLWAHFCNGPQGCLECACHVSLSLHVFNAKGVEERTPTLTLISAGKSLNFWGALPSRFGCIHPNSTTQSLAFAWVSFDLMCNFWREAQHGKMGSAMGIH